MVYNAEVMKELEKALRGYHCLVFIDLEGTQVSHEMIELGAYKCYLKDDLTVKKVFKPIRVYVKAKGKVGPIVTKLTGITDLKLKKDGITFREAQQKLRKYVAKDWEKCLFVSYGNQDGKIFLASGERNMDASMPEARFVSHHMFDLCEFIARFVKPDADGVYSLTNCLKVFEVEFQGQAHDAAADAYNLLLLYKAFLDRKDILAREYKKRLTHLHHLPLPIRYVCDELAKGSTITPEAYDAIVEKSLA